MAVMGNFYFSIFLRLTWEFLGFESERRGSVCWPNNKIIDKRRQKIAQSPIMYPQPMARKKEIVSPRSLCPSGAAGVKSVPEQFLGRGGM